MEREDDLPAPPVSEVKVAAAVAWLKQQPIGGFYLRWMAVAERSGQMAGWLIMINRLRLRDKPTSQIAVKPEKVGH